MKKCSKCNTEKLLTDFYVSARGLGGRQSHCKVCMASKHKQHRAANIAHYESVRINYVADNKARYAAWKFSQCCILCGEDDPCCLDSHHIDPNAKEFSIGAKSPYTPWHQIEIELSKCVTVCSNCHRKIHSGKVILLT